MLGFQEKKEAKYNLKKALYDRKSLVLKLNKKGEYLHHLKSEKALNLVQKIENYLTELAGHPKNFGKAANKFIQVQHNYKKEYEDLSDKHGFDITDYAGKGSGALAAAGAGALAPTALMSIASTFGTASTGTAISSLSGAAATNAATAWLGGGALAAGGGGMGTGSVVLAAGGPIGGVVAGGLLVASALKVSKDNNKAVKEFSSKSAEIEEMNSTLELSLSEIETTIERLNQEITNCLNLLTELRQSAPNLYSNFKKAEKKLLANLINHVQIVTALMKT